MIRLPSRPAYVGLALVTIAAGLLVRGPGDARDFGGDALWGSMILWWVSALVPRSSVPVRAGAALAFCFAIEASQLLHTPSLDALRRTLPGQLVLGSGFDARDLVAYALGVTVAAAIDFSLRRSYAGSTHG